MAVLKIRDPATGEWVDITGTGSQGADGPEEVFVGADDPRPTLPDIDLWFDTDAPTPPPEGLGTVAVLKSSILAHTFIGPWAETNANAVWTVTLPAGTYMAVFNVGSVSTGTGSRGVNLWVDGVKTNIQSYLYFNTAAVHHMMNTDMEPITLTAGEHTFWAKDNGSVLGDNNDRGALLLIPCETP